ncbi:MAG TPA: hypothetical protein DEQ38_14515 [Elusimicrobia bacterium]|nr:MAG: hypothetical protein A2089_02975 [Elusimicrobia bacterium GWD2_63_28]HCC49305.1 hypothetical protein [Elusimicrobiota bacterium]
MTTHAKPENEVGLEQLISNYGGFDVKGKDKDEHKYRDIVRAMQWARHLRRQDDFRSIPMAELIDRALLDVVSGKIKVAEIEEAVKKDQEIEEKLSSKRSDDPKKLRAREDKPAKEAA